MSRALVTGATGFIGGHLVEELLRRNWEVVCLIRNPRKIPHGLVDRLQVIQADICDRQRYCQQVEGIDVVFHLAGQIHALTRRAMMQTNVEGTRQIVGCCAAIDAQL